MKHKLVIHSIIFIIILLASLVSFYIGRGNSIAQIAASVLVSVAYVIWGIRYHAILGELHRTIVIEYVLVGLIAIILLITLSI